MVVLVFPARLNASCSSEEFEFSHSFFMMMMRDDILRSSCQTPLDNNFLLYYSLSSLAILDAISLKPIEVPDILLNRTPFKDNRGNLHTSISH